MSARLGRYLVICLVTGVLLAGGLLLFRRRTEQPQNHAQFDRDADLFRTPPYVHPKIIQDLTTWLSDLGDQVVAINLIESQKSNRYHGDVLVREIPGEAPFVYVQEQDGRFDYQYVGTTDSGVHVLLTLYSGGGSGIFTDLLFVTLERDQGLDCDLDRQIIQSGRERLLIRKLGAMGLGDRWSGDLRVDGNRLFVGKDKGWFAETNKGGQFSLEGKDRVFEIQLNRRVPERTKEHSSPRPLPKGKGRSEN